MMIRLLIYTAAATIGLLAAAAPAAAAGDADQPAHTELASEILGDATLNEVHRMAKDLLQKGFNAGSGYGEVWIRDLNTFIEVACEVNPPQPLREALLTFFKFQGSNGDIVDGYIPKDRAKESYAFRSSAAANNLLAHKNTVETDQEASLLQAVRKYVRATGDQTILQEQIGGVSVRERLGQALQYVLTERFDREHGLVWGATTADWGDVQPESPWGVELDANSHRALDIYDNAMLVIAINDYRELLGTGTPEAVRWKTINDELKENIRKHLWDAAKRKIIPHVYLDGSPFPKNFDENAIYYHGGTAVAIEAGLLTREEVAGALEQMVANVRASGAASIGLTVYPPYPDGFFKNKSMRAYSYQNGGDWCWFGGRMIQALVQQGYIAEAYRELQPMAARVKRVGGFHEWWSRDNQPRGSGEFRGSAGVLGRAIELLQAWARQHQSPSEFHAYYSRVDSGEPFERFSRTGDYADIIVKLGAPEGKLVFCRGSSYLPYWETAKGKWFLDEFVPRRGDGEGKQHDRVNAFARVALVESTPERVLVYWRYLPQFSSGNPYKGMDPTRFVEESFEILPNGKITRTIKQGTPKIDDWNDPLNHTTQVLQLSGDGIREISRTEPGHSPPAKPVHGNPLRGDAVIRPVREWRFDEAAGDRAVESITGEPSDIAGHKSLWRKGMSGTCLQFDDYNTVVSLPAAKAPAIAGALTLEGWFAIGAYPWNWAPIVQQGDDTGYFLGVDAHGQAGFKLKVGDTWQELVATNALDRFHWHHAAGTYDRASGDMSLYLDGKLVATKPVGGAGITTAPEPIQIGKGKPRRPVDPVRANTFTTSYSFDGLIDEVRIYDQALAPEQIASSCQKFLPPPDLAAAPDMDRRALPKFNTGGRFGAHYTRLKFYDVWDNLWRVGPYADVVVGFDQSPAKFVFWRGAGHIPMLVNEADQWYSNEFNETWGRSGGKGCQEPMSDKESFFNHVRVIENTPARVVIQWRFPLVDVLHVIANYHPETGWGDWSDWYYYIYPDGVAVKTMHLWTDGPRNHEWHESMAILGPNQHPDQVLETDPALILADLNGNATPYSWKQGPPKVDYRNQKTHVVNYRAQYDPFTIGDFTGGNVYSGEVTSYSVFPSWNHWPVAQIPSDGRYAKFPDRAAHCSLTHVRMPDFRAGSGDRPFQEKLLMEGMSKLGAKELAPLARSWLQAPEIESLADCRDQHYDPAQRAYVLGATGAAPSFRIAASAERPIVNPCFVVRNWNCEDNAKLEINSAAQAGGPNFRQGIVRDPNGKPLLVVWLQHEATGPTTFTLRGARPEASADKPAGGNAGESVPNQNSRNP